VGLIDFTPGALVGRYRIVERIGEGGMAEVYLGHATDGTRVAIKRLLPLFANDPRFIDMFVAEARLAATLHHVNIAKVFDVGVDHGACYFAMELVDGRDVRTLIAAASVQGRPMPLTIALSIMYGTTCALAYVHDPRGPHAKLNVVHRDISPSNILVSYDGAIKLVDFGIARVESGAVTRSASGQLKGKIPYMSPEQCRARPLDGRSDLFSLGVVLYELTTNTRPFDHDSEFDTLEAIVSGRFARPSKVVRGYPAALEDIVMRLLATRPADRYPSANALLLDLDGVIATHGVDLSSDVLAAHVQALLQGRPPPPKKQRVSRLDTVPAITPVDPASRDLAVARLPIDRVVLRCDEILRTVAPEVADACDLSADAVGVLIGRAMRAHAKGDLENAVLSLELALSAERTAEVDGLLANNDSLIMAVFGAFLGGQARTIALSQHIEQLVGIEIDQRAAFLLTRIDGALTARELLATCGLPPREACRHLCQLLLRELVVLV
jgi:serine/threonine protein kinase